VIVMDRGRIVEDGPPAEALSPQAIARVFGVSGEWVGEAGRFAFSA
jgi:iron complex transport system ATP-binding protein